MTCPSDLVGATIEGQIVDSNYSGVAGEKVSLKQGTVVRQSVYTDAHGYFVFDFLDLYAGGSAEVLTVVWGDKTSTITFLRSERFVHSIVKFTKQS